MYLKMENLLKLINKHYSPYLIFLILFVGYLILYMPYRAFTTSGGEQTIMIDFGFIYLSFPYFMILVSLSCFIFYFKKIKQFWHYNSIVLIVFLLIGINNYTFYRERNKFSIRSKNVSDKYRNIRYYQLFYNKTNTIYLEKYIIDGLKDSIWIYYDIEGNITRTIEYDKGLIVSDIKHQIFDKPNSIDSTCLY